ncbi:CAP-Gly domain-containing linker protein 1-like isoform X2 [Metopolophium dirhodum]|uniref:CAP-Gly domain-containing linker protein 1-like isoform X2 n=1 Tax=Metopolophium dirhodum TaxID=44670 RepID=UPI00298FC5F9|nr:CAP-Gly domain-containing linker protein 1-like isoform X2 [Metopolophium dirhodum]
MPNPVFEETIIPRHLDLFCRADDGVSSIATRLDGGSSVKKTADMAYVSKHNDFNKKPTDERKSSSGSDSFMGDARRLSEAGVRRSSGNSVVLTEDTDKFIIGNRIWVGGTKPGQIAYIGETNFGNGDWAGVVLDEPIGKNDGSVSGTRYFQCGPKRGIFARLTNLTSAPLSSVEDSMVQSSFAATKPLGFSTPMPKRQGSTLTATKTAAKSISQTPIAKSSSDLKIGDRVIISSGQGSKLGVLRYRGATQFAPGEWCGIELDDPLGKNNGIVEGIKYFECEDKFGLFTPIAKVSKSPMSASRMSTNCAIHKAKRSPGSMNGSMISGITSTTMSSIPTRPTKVSDMDRLKLELTQKKNENELLRSQFIKAANQADVAEKKLEETLKAQVEQPSEIQVNGIIMLQNQLDNIKKQIDDEKEKVQNLQFTNEEQNVVNIELQNKNAELLIKIKELDFDLAKERSLAKDVEKEKMKMFEKEEELCRVKEELETLKKLIDNNEDELQKSVSNLSSEVVDKEAILNTLRQTLNENSQTHDRLLKEANENLSATTERLTKVIEEKEKKIEQNQEMIDQLNEGIKCLSALKNEEHDDIVNNLKNELLKLENEYKVIINEKEQDTKIIQEKHIKIENELKQELKSLSENKNQEYLEKLEKLENVNQNINTELKAALKSVQDQTTVIADLEKKFNDLELQQDSTKNELEKKLTTKLKTVENELTCLKSEKSMLEEKHEIYVKETINATNTLDNKLKQNNILIENLNKSLNELTLSKQNEFDSMKKQILQLEGERDELLKQQSLELATKDELINILSNKLELSLTEKQKQDLSNANLQTELTNETTKYQTTIKDLQNKINELEVNIASNQETYKSELELLSNEKLTSTSENLNLLEKLKSLENSKLNLEEKLASNEICIQDIQHLNNAIEEKNKIIDDNQIKIKQLDNCVIQTKNKYEVTLKQKEEEIKELLKIGEEKMEIEKLSLEEKTKVILNDKDKETSILHKKIVDLENIKKDLEIQLETGKSLEQDLKQSNEIIQDNIKTIKDNNLKIENLNNLISLTKNEFESKLQGKEVEIKDLLKTAEEKLFIEKKQIEEQNKAMLNEKNNEISNLVEKLSILENTKTSVEQQLIENSKKQENMIAELKISIEEKTKLINNNNLNIEQLNSLIEECKEKFNLELKEKEDKMKELINMGEEKLTEEKLTLEKHSMLILDEKNNEISKLMEKLSILENSKTSVEQQLIETSKKQENMIAELKISIEEKTKLINDNNLNIEQLNSLIEQCKEKFNSELKEKEDKMKKLIKIAEEKLTEEKLTLEKHSMLILDEKNNEISKLMEKLSILENSKTSVEQQLIENSKKQENMIAELKISIEEKTKLINDNNLNIEQLNSMIEQCKEKFNSELKEKEDKMKELIKVREEQLTEEKNNEISKLMEKLSILENSKTSVEQQLIENSKKQENMIAELKISIKEKTKLINDNNLNIEQLNSMIEQCKEKFNSELKEKEDKMKELIKVREEQLTEEKNNEISKLMEKLSILENSKTSVEQQLIETSKKQENMIAELKISIEEKTKLINDNNLNIEQLNSLIEQCKEKFNLELKEKEDKMKELIKVGEDKLTDEKLVLEKNSMLMLDERNNEISNLMEKLNILENSKSNLEKQLDIYKNQEHDIIKLKKAVEEKNKIIDDNNSKVELLNSLITQTKDDFDVRLKEKENETDKLVKIVEDKLNVEKMAFETRIKSCLDEKNTEIKVLKNQLHEFAENNTEKELMLKLESIINELEKEKLRALNLEALKIELEKTVLQHKTELELLEVSKNNMQEDMVKTIEKQQGLNAELTAKTKTESERLDTEKLNIQKQIDGLQIECSRLRSTLEEKNHEIENLKVQMSQELKTTVSCDDELSQLKALLDKGHSAQSHLEFRIQELTDENHRLNERIEGDRNLLQKNHNIIQEKYNIDKKYEETYNILKIKENQILVLQTELNSWKLKDTEKSKNNNAQENTDKSEAHLLAEKNQEIKMLNSIILGLHKKLSAVMETDVSEYEIAKNPESVSKEDYQKLYKTAKNNVKLKECENLSLKHEINKLKTENDRYSEFKTKCEILENDKKTLQKLIVSYDNSIPTNVKSDTKSETEKILEEKDWQINLLNNIIADLHAKVSDNKFKIEALETQILDSGVDHSKKTRLRTTRLYCERCEIFDSHDTEDCPEKPESPKFQRKRRVVNDGSNKMIDEPFCVCCDMFGHTADECDNSLTF